MGKLSSFEMRELAFKALKANEGHSLTASEIVSWGQTKGIISKGEISETDLASELVLDIDNDANSVFTMTTQETDDSSNKIRNFALKPDAYKLSLYDDVPADKLEEFSARINRFFESFSNRKIADIPMMEYLIAALGYDIYNPKMVEKTKENNFIIYPECRVAQLYITSFNDEQTWDYTSEYAERMRDDLKNRCIPMALVLFKSGIRLYYYDLHKNQLITLGSEGFETGCRNYESFWFASAFGNNCHKYGEAGRTKLKVWRSLSRTIAEMPDEFLAAVSDFVPVIKNASLEEVTSAVKQYFRTLTE